MSIIIRLQNLPLSARSGDIRNFFGGLRIPDGGVHITGGNSGDAFIAFMSDEDARIAMRKDGGKIKGSRIKLFLSSCMEMQHEVGKVTNSSFTGGSPQPALIETPISGTRSRSSERKRRSNSRSPSKHDGYKSRPAREHKRSPSPSRYQSRSSRYRSRSPRRSVSPKRRERSSSRSRKNLPRKRSVSPKMGNYGHQTGEAVNDFSLSLSKNSQYSDLKSQLPTKSQIQSDLEKRITAELEKNATFRSMFGIDDHQESNIPAYDASIRRDVSHGIKEFSRQGNMQNEMYPHHNSPGIHHFQDKFKQQYMSAPQSSEREKIRQNMSDNLYIIMSGLAPDWNFREVQLILKGVFAPMYNMRWERRDKFKTGTVFIKLSNKDDFDDILKKGTFDFKNRTVTVKECPKSVSQKHFRFSSDTRSDHYNPQDRDLCYTLKGLPFTCRREDVISFFQGLEVADVVINYAEDGRATGTGFVSFTNWEDFERAMTLNGKKIGHRYIELLPGNKKEMSEAKNAYYNGTFVPYSTILSEKKLPSSRRPLCAILTGLPLSTTIKQISSFFTEADLKPDAIHLTLSKYETCDGRAFVEFSNFLDFDLALKFHGKRFESNIICVKQILYDEMVKILDSQRSKHHFAMSDPASDISDEPEKVPYLWEPPDEEFDNSDIYTKGYGVGVSSRPSFGSSSSGARRNFDDTYEAYNTTQFNMNRPGREKFHSTRKYEENIKSSRLSPENEAALLDFLNKGRKPFPDKRSRSRNENSSRYNDDLKYDSYHKTSIQLDPFHSENVRKNRDSDLKECVVQLSNVNTSATSQDLLNFLKGYDFNKDTLIRGYTAEGEPTPDVRVTFYSRWEAVQAVKKLNKTYFQNKKITMFIAD